MLSRKLLGQHFLNNPLKIKQIIDSLNIAGGETIIEIGSGHGELTKDLGIRSQKLGVRIIGIEKDRELAAELKKRFENNKNIEIIEGDALKLLPTIIHNSQFKIQNYKIVGNIPYYITGHLLRLLSDLVVNDFQSVSGGGMMRHTTSPFTLAVLTVQKEVAERICAKPPKMNLLAASVQFWAEPEIVDFISKRDFQPQPKVDSAIIRLKTKPVIGHKSLVVGYYKLIKVLFKQPRKTIRNNLKGLKINAAALENFLKETGINPNDRPQNLGIEEIKKLIGVL